MMIREFRILATNQIWEGFYLPDGSGDIQCLTNKGHEIFYEWEFASSPVHKYITN